MHRNYSLARQYSTELIALSVHARCAVREQWSWRKIAVFFALGTWFHTSNWSLAPVIRTQEAIENVAILISCRSDHRKEIRHLRFFVMSGMSGCALRLAQPARDKTNCEVTVLINDGELNRRFIRLTVSACPAQRARP